jgi:hypothetical protein
MMKDISQLIHFWIVCCNDLWRKRFENRNNGGHDCAEIEESLFHILVARPLGQAASTSTMKVLLDRLRVQYVSDFQEDRQVCVTQKAGNIFCKTETITLKKGTDYRIKSIDTMGTMMDSEPYVEVIIGEKFVLDYPRNLRFLLPD